MSVGDINSVIVVAFCIIFVGVSVWTYKKFYKKVKNDTDKIKNLNMELSVFNNENAEENYSEIDRMFHASDICLKSYLLLVKSS